VCGVLAVVGVRGVIVVHTFERGVGFVNAVSKLMNNN
jgi:hypothetical protein